MVTAALIAHLDANVVGHLEDCVPPATPAAIDLLYRAIKLRQLRVVPSTQTAQELLGAWKASPALAARLERRYATLLGPPEPRRLLKEPPTLLRDAVEAYAAGTRQRSGTTPFTASQKRNWIDVGSGAASKNRISETLSRWDTTASGFKAFLDDAACTVRGNVTKLRQEAKRRGERFVTPSFADLWPSLWPYYTEGLVEGSGRTRAIRRACLRRGLGGLLRREPALAFVGGVVAIAYTQSIQGRRPDDGDLMDLRHVISAAGLGPSALFVTNDRRLREKLAMIPGLRVRVLSLSDLLSLL